MHPLHTVLCTELMRQFSTKEHDSKDGNMAQLVHPFPFILNELPCNLVQIFIFQILLTLVISPNLLF